MHISHLSQRSVAHIKQNFSQWQDFPGEAANVGCQCALCNVKNFPANPDSDQPLLILLRDHSTAWCMLMVSRGFIIADKGDSL